MTLDALLPLLRCPDCAEPLAFEAVDQHDAAAGACGVLRCGCARYPVVDGVPILVRGRLDVKSIGDARVLSPGPTTDEVLGLVAAGDGLAALTALLTFPVCPWPLNQVGAARALSLAEPFHSAGRAAGGSSTRKRLARRDALTAEDWLAAFYLHTPTVYDPFNYFAFRFTQPKHLATSGLVARLPQSERPLLDVACGYGHLLHAPTTTGQPAIGLDQNFHQAWVARHYVAPGAAFLCADADRPLPLADGAISAAFVSDAFPYLRHKTDVLDELRRVTADGPRLLTSVGNADSEYVEEGELTAEGYAALLDAHAGPGRWHAWTDAALVEHYLAPDGPTPAPSSLEALAEARYLTFATGMPETVDRGDAPPHAAGSLRLNPLYRVEAGEARFVEPSAWYMIENAGLRAYMPVAAPWPEAVAAAVARGEVTPAVQALIDRFVVIGVPARYLRARRPLTQRAHREVMRAMAGARRGLRGVAAVMALG